MKEKLYRSLFIDDEECGGELMLYLHIPFCVQKCLYCDFLSAPAGDETQDRYMEALFQEIRGRAEEGKAYEVSSIFIGGGTPSVVRAGRIVELLQIIKAFYSLKRDVEITIEVNPGTVTKDMLKQYFEAGINRLSIGLQSCHNDELKRLGRIHTYDAFLESYYMARQAGFRNINVDLMSGLPGQTKEMFLDTLEQITCLNPPPEHISAYSLIVEEGTVFFDMQQKGILKLPDEDLDREIYKATGVFLNLAGYERYEISNYARKGYCCRHNKGYWQRKNYLGFGIGAASLLEEKRFFNSPDLISYLEHPLGVRERTEKLQAKDQMEETMFLGLRMMKGVSYEDFYRTYGQKLEQVYGEIIEENRQQGLLDVREGRVFLTEKGIDISNYILAQFLLE